MATRTLRGLSKQLVLMFCFVAAFCLSSVSTKWVQSSIDTKEDWKFLTRFCFLSKDGHFEYTFKYPVSYGVQQLLLYYDRPGQWESVYKSSLNCSERSSKLSKVNNQIIDLTNKLTNSRDAGCTLYKQDGVDYYNCTDHVNFQSSRERWWFLVVARCEPSRDGKVGLKLDYLFHLMNGYKDDYLHHELSADEFYILPVDIAFLLVYIVLLVLSIICAVILFNRQQFHTTYKMYITALCLHIFGLFLQCIAWGRYGSSGWQEKPTEVTGRLFQAASIEVFLLMLLLIAKGYTITRGRLTQMSTVRLSIFFCLYTIVNITLFIWEGQFFDEGLVLYFYESPPGYGLIAMRIIGWLWFFYAFFFTMKHHSHKAKFYVPFFIFYTAWFFAGPIVILIAIFSIAKWSREKTVNGVEEFVSLCGYLFFLVLTRPSAANKNFPYHLRVSQVRFSDDDSEPTERYGISEESKQHLDTIFTVSGSSFTSTSLSTTTTTTSTSSTSSNIRGKSPGYQAENGGGYVNHGYVNGYAKSKPGLETDHTNGTATSNGKLPPSYDLASQLPPIATRATHCELPPLERAPTTLPPIGSRVPNTQETGSAQQLPPIGGKPDPQQEDTATTEQLPPVLSGGGGGGGGERLPPLHHGGTYPVNPDIFRATPSAPHME